MLSLAEILDRIDKEIKDLQFDEPPKSLYAPIEYILSLGGKRIRPALAIIACNIYNDSIEPSIRPALALEVFHNFTLLHDDLMDQADMRRNKPTVHKAWNPNTAILSGDAMLIASYDLLREVDNYNLSNFMQLFTQMALQICGGQQYDMEFEARLDVAVDEYLEMIRLKTAVLLATALKLGALAGGASVEDAEHLYQYGIHIGIAFQLKDDLLDTYGDPVTFGKNIGGDILCNKKTYLLIQALKNATPSQKEELIKWMDKKTFVPSEKIAAFTSIYNQIGVNAICEEKIQYYYTIAQNHLNVLSVPKEKLNVLQEVSKLLMFRKS